MLFRLRAAFVFAAVMSSRGVLKLNVGVARRPDVGYRDHDRIFDRHGRRSPRKRSRSPLRRRSRSRSRSRSHSRSPLQSLRHTRSVRYCVHVPKISMDL